MDLRSNSRLEYEGDIVIVGMYVSERLVEPLTWW
jgi:hypothetical protein